MAWFWEGMCFLPTFLVIWSSCTFIINYVIAVFRRDIDVIFPYISDTGARPPESCVFGFMATVSAFAGLTTMFAKYKFIQRLNEKTGGVPPALNKASLFCAVVSCMGMCIVATFQETGVPIIHDLGAFAFFISGVLYIILQTVISYITFPLGSSRSMCYIRTIFALVALLGTITTIICASIVKTTKLHWNTEDKDYTLHSVSAVCEWMVAFTFVFFFFTYIQEFKQFTMNVRIDLQEFT